jgi:subtilisin family serine protease
MKKKSCIKAAIGAGAFALPLAVSAASFIVLGTPGANLEAAVKVSGGKVTSRLVAIDAVVADGDAAFKARIEKQKGVQSVAPNLTIRWLPSETRSTEAVAEAVDPPNNPPGSIDSRFNLQWGHTAVRAVDAWNYGYKGSGAKVAVLDGGFSLNHPDIEFQYDPDCTADMTGEGIAYGPNSDDPTGIFAHGMHTAGTVAAAMNMIGTIGVAPEAKLCLVKVLLNYGSGSFDDVAEGIIYAADKGVDIINMSLGGAIYKAGVPGEYTAREAAELKNFMARAVGYAYKRGVLVITSAGNEGIDGDKDGALIHLPSDTPNAMSVSATAPIGWAVNPAAAFLDFPASYTNYGRSVISVAGPGGDASYPGNENCTVAGLTRPCYVFDFVFSTGAVVGASAYYYWSAGTSMAAPHVAGVAALIVSRFGKMHPSKLRTKLERGSDDLGQPGNDPFYGAGRVNAIKSMQ